MRLIVSDLDGTLLLKGESTLHRLTESAIGRLIDGNTVFCVASGRNYGELKRIMKDFDGEVYFIAHDGALIVYKEKSIFEAPIEKALLKGFDGEESLVAHGKYLSFVKSGSKRFIREIKAQYLGHIAEIDSIDDINEPIYKVTVYGKKDCGCSLNKVYCGHTSCEYVANGINKGRAVAELSKILKTDNVIAIGDGINDAEMLKSAAKAYVIASAPPRVKKLGTDIVKEFKDAVDDLSEG